MGQSSRPSNLGSRSPTGKNGDESARRGYLERRPWAPPEAEQGCPGRRWPAGLGCWWRLGFEGVAGIQILSLPLFPVTFPWLGQGSPTYPLQIEDCGHLGEPGKLVSDGPGGHRGEVGNE